MIYLDNAATSFWKPESVIRAVGVAMRHSGNAGRGTHGASLDASRIIYEAREKISDFFGLGIPTQTAFAANATEALNTAVKGVLKPGDRVVTTVLEHNSVLRPLYEMQAKGVELLIAGADQNGRPDTEQLKEMAAGKARMVICTHASNLTGNLVDIADIGAFCKREGILFVVDAAQTAGVFPIDMRQMGIDILCFTGHKGLLGPQGTGGICIRENVTVEPLKTGGSGIRTYEKKHPHDMPTALEAGTLNLHGIAGLSAAIDYLNETGIDRIRAGERMLMTRFYEGVKDIPGVKVYGDFESNERAAIVSLNIRDYDSAEISDALSEEYGIATRPGAHCAPLMHEALGTVEQGAVRFSFSYANTTEEIDQAVVAVRELAKE